MCALTLVQAAIGIKEISDDLQRLARLVYGGDGVFPRACLGTTVRESVPFWLLGPCMPFLGGCLHSIDFFMQS